MFYAKLNKIDRYQHTWPVGDLEKYDALHFTVRINKQDVPVIVGFTEREAFRRKRKRIVVFVSGTPEVEFCEVDDYESSGHVVAVLKKPHSEKMYNVAEVPPSEYSEFQIVHHKDFIRGGYDRSAVLARVDDIHTMIKHALTRAKLEAHV